MHDWKSGKGNLKHFLILQLQTHPDSAQGTSRSASILKSHSISSGSKSHAEAVNIYSYLFTYQCHISTNMCYEQLNSPKSQSIRVLASDWHTHTNTHTRLLDAMCHPIFDQALEDTGFTCAM